MRRLTEQFIVHLPAFRRTAQANLGHLDLILQLQVSLGVRTRTAPAGASRAVRIRCKNSP